QPVAAIKAGARGLTPDRRRFRFQRLLVVLQISVSLVLVAGAILFVRSFRGLVTIDPGLSGAGGLPATFDLGKQSHDEGLLRQLLAEVGATPQVESAAITTHFLIASGIWSLIVHSDTTNRDARFAWVSPGFFATLEMPIRAGRDFTENDS